MTCIQCQRFDLKASPKLAKHGFGGCKAKPNGSYCSASAAICKDFIQTPADQVAARIEWLKKQQDEFNADVDRLVAIGK